MNRRKFIISSSMTACAMSTFGSVVEEATGKFVGDCGTTNDILGPFYRPDAPIRSDLTFAGLAGTVVTLKGKVFKADCVTPLPDAMVEIWHCNSKGDYDNDSKEYLHRARLFTGKAGDYRFKTILPGKYLNGELYRPSHIHYRVTEKNSRELISQIYFMGDPQISADPWASKEKARHRILQIAPEDTQGNLAINFDIYLESK